MLRNTPTRPTAEAVDSHVVLDLTTTGVLPHLAAALAYGGDGVRHAWDRLARSRGTDVLAARDLLAAEFVRAALRLPLTPADAEVLSIALADAAADADALLAAHARASEVGEAAREAARHTPTDPRREP